MTIFKKLILSIHSELGDAIIKKRSCWSREEEGGVHWFERKGEQRSWPQSRTVSLLLITSNSWEKRHSSAPRALCACFPASQTPPQPSHFAAPLKHTLSPLSLPHLMMFLRKKTGIFTCTNIPALLMNISEACELCVMVQDLTASALYLDHRPMMAEQSRRKPIPPRTITNISESGLELSTISLMGEHWMHVVEGWSQYYCKISKMIPTCRAGSSALAAFLLLVFSIPWSLMSLIREQLQMEKHINMWAQIALDKFQLALDVQQRADLVTQHIFHT